MTAHPAGTKPPLYVLLQNSLIFLGVSAPAVDDSNTRKPGSQGLEQELLENKSRFLLVQAMQIQMR